jgi:lipopolysaccharide export system protein LptA
MFRAFLSLLATLTAAAFPVDAGTAPDEGPGRTVIESDRLEVLDTEEGNRFVFDGAVRIVGADFEATCDRMEVRTAGEADADEAAGFGAIEEVVATGSVRIVQGARVATAGRAVIFPRENRVVLEDGPVVRDGRGTVRGHRMVLHGKDRRITVEPGPDSGRPTVELPSLEAVGAAAEPGGGDE